MNSLGETAQRLIQSHPESAEDLQEKCTELNQAWNSLGKRADQRKEKLGDSHDLQRFLSDFRLRCYSPPPPSLSVWYIISKVDMAYCSTGVFLGRVQKRTVFPVLTYFNGGREKLSH